MFPSKTTAMAADKVSPRADQALMQHTDPTIDSRPVARHNRN